MPNPIYPSKIKKALGYKRPVAFRWFLLKTHKRNSMGGSYVRHATKCLLLRFEVSVKRDLIGLPVSSFTKSMTQWFRGPKLTLMNILNASLLESPFQGGFGEPRFATQREFPDIDENLNSVIAQDIDKGRNIKAFITNRQHHRTSPRGVYPQRQV